MAQPAFIPIPASEPARLPATKRRRDLDFPLDSGPTRRCKSQCHDVIFRVVVPSRQIGKVIGKEGCRIQKIREASRASIKIADAVARNEERVIIISSKGSDDETTDAENALQQIAGLILKDDENGSEAAKVGAGHVVANTIRLLIAGSQAGSLIGMSGQNIEKLRNSSGATITVLAPSQLPLCASAHESDRVVQISGDVPAVQKGLEEIGCQIRENPPKQVISLSPAYNYTAIRPPQVQPYIDPTSAEYITIEMIISETMVGGLIGRCGSNISRIRNETGAMIKVYGGKGEEKHRQIQFCVMPSRWYWQSSRLMNIFTLSWYNKLVLNRQRNLHALMLPNLFSYLFCHVTVMVMRILMLYHHFDIQHQRNSDPFND